jgi:predicted nucleotidyltransferase
VHSLPINYQTSALAAFCRANGICRLALFGSVLREDFTEQSDVDCLVEFEAGKRIGMMGMVRLERGLSQILGRKVDLRTPRELSSYFVGDVLREARPIYVAA